MTATCAVVGSACTVVRGDLFGNPFIGRILRAAWHIDAGDGASMAGAAVVQGALDRLAAGLRVLIFPEGTRSPAGGSAASAAGPSRSRAARTSRW